MKRINLVLVLLLTLSLASSFSFVSHAEAGEIPEPNTNIARDYGDQTVGLTGDPDDNSEGDPGNQGDGLGAVGGPVISLGPDGQQDSDKAIMDEISLFLIMMIQQLAP